MGTSVTGILVCVALTIAIARGHNWARLTWAILFVVGMLFTPMIVNRLPEIGPYWIINMVVQLGLQVVALVGLFSRDASAWFRQHVQQQIEKLAATPGSRTATSATLPDAPGETAPTDRIERDCPSCAERILAKATRCRFCGQPVPATQQPGGVHGA
jgi:hypothetical protein